MQHYDAIRLVLRRVRSRWRTRCVCQASVRAALAASAVLGVALIVARWIDRAPIALAFVGAAAVLLVAAAVVWGCSPLRGIPTEQRVARFIEEHDPSLGDRLVSAVDVVRSERYALSPALIEPMLADAARRASAIDLDTIVSRASLRRAGLQAAATVALLLTLVVMARGPAGQAVDAASLALFPSRVALDVTPGRARIKAGSPLTIQARLVGNRAPVAPRVEIADADRWRAIEMTGGAGTFRLALASVTAPFTYRVVAGSVRSPAYEVAVAHAPRVARIDVDYRYPAGLGLEPRTERDGGDIYAPAGTDVRVTVVTDRPAATARLALGDGKTIALTTGAPTAFTASMKITADNSYRIALADNEGLSNPGETEYFIRMLEDRPPEVHVLKPASDRSVTRLEEVDVEAQAEDDYGIASMDLVYAVRGGAEQVVPIGGGQHATTVTGRHTLYLEDLDVQPGDFVSYYVRARDVTRGTRPSEAKSDIYFLEVKPFEQEFQLAQSQAQGGGGSSSVDDLVTAQKDIVVATWKLDRRAGAAKGAQPEKDIRSVSRAQADLKSRVEQTASTFREATMRDPRHRPQRGAPPDVPKAGQTLPEEDAMTAASTAMGKAVTSLDGLKTHDALPPEMQALNHLLKAQADVKRRQVSRQQAGSGSGDNNRNFDMSTLFDKELQRQQQTNYENKSTSEQHQDAHASALDKIKELARRQDELLKHQQDLARQRGQISEEEVKRALEQLTREQSELRQQAEEIARQMSTPQSASEQKPGDRSGNAGQSGQQQGESGSGSSRGASGGDGGKQMRDISDEMRSATSDLRRQDPGQASARGSRALDKLRDLEKQLQSTGPDERRRALGEMQLEARQLADAQRQLASEVGKTPAGEAGSDAARRLAGDEERLAGRARKLQENLKQQASGAGAADPAEARQGRDGRPGSGANTTKNGKTPKAAAGDAARDLETQQLAERMQKSADDLRAGAAGGAPKDPRAQAAAQEDLARSLDKVADTLHAATGSRDEEGRKLSDQLARAQELRDRMAGLSRDVERLGKQSGRGSAQPSGQKSPGESGRTGEGRQAGNGGSGSDLARLREEYTRQLQKTRDLLDEMRREDPNFAKSGAGFTFEGQGMTLSAPGTEAFKQDFAAWEILRQQATQALDKAESALSKKLQSRDAKDRLAAGVDDKPPSQYQRQVDSYFKAIAAKKKP
jgi:uncharacterized protein DUF4175